VRSSLSQPESGRNSGSHALGFHGSDRESWLWVKPKVRSVATVPFCPWLESSSTCQIQIFCGIQFTVTQINQKIPIMDPKRVRMFVMLSINEEISSFEQLPTICGKIKL